LAGRHGASAKLSMNVRSDIVVRLLAPDRGFAGGAGATTANVCAAGCVYLSFMEQVLAPDVGGGPFLFIEAFMTTFSKLLLASAAALSLGTGMAAAQVPDLGGDSDRRQLRLERQSERAERQAERAERGGLREEGGLRDETREFRRAQREQLRGDDVGRERAIDRRAFDRDEDATGSTRFERAQARDRDTRVIIRERDRRPDVRFRFRDEPDVFVRTLAPTYRYVVVGGSRCRVTITRRVNRAGRIVTSERRQCPGRPEVVIRTRR
jgi:hypothetical protein